MSDYFRETTVSANSIPEEAADRESIIELSSGPSTSAAIRKSEQDGIITSRASNQVPQTPEASLENEAGPPQTSNTLKVSKMRGVAVFITLAGIGFLNTMGSGIFIAANPRIVEDVGIPSNFVFWPTTIYALSAECLLFIFGTVADAIGTKLIWVAGSFLCTICTFAVALARTTFQIILFRAFLGVGKSMCLSAAVDIIIHTFPKGPWRNTAFMINGIAQPLGYAVGLFHSGIFIDTIGWRWVYHMMAIINVCLSMASIWSLPSVNPHSERKGIRHIMEDIDWLGGIIISAALGFLMYAMATTYSSFKKIIYIQSIVLLTVPGILLIAFPCWMNYRYKRARPPPTPSRPWSFTSICIFCSLYWVSLNRIEYFLTLYLQEDPSLPTSQSSIRLASHVIMAIFVVSFATAYLIISRIRARTLAVVSALITMIGPGIMGTVDDDDENIGFSPLWVLLLWPVVPDGVSPAGIQFLARGSASRFGNYVGLVVNTTITASIMGNTGIQDYKEALMESYPASF